MIPKIGITSARAPWPRSACEVRAEVSRPESSNTLRPASLRSLNAFSYRRRTARRADPAAPCAARPVPAGSRVAPGPEFGATVGSHVPATCGAKAARRAATGQDMAFRLAATPETMRDRRDRPHRRTAHRIADAAHPATRRRGARAGRQSVVATATQVRFINGHATSSPSAR